MVRQTVVLAPPPGTARRPVVVLREGPPDRERRAIYDIAAGIVGIALLILAVVLVPLLPEEEVAPEQFQVTFQDRYEEDPTLRAEDLSEGASTSIPIEVPADDMYRIELTVEWTDDIASSLADAFTFSLVDPTGAEVIAPVTFTNPDPESDGSAAGAAYAAQTATRIIAYDVAARPTTQVVTADDGQTQEEIEATAVEETLTGSAGTWSLMVTLTDAGDCPDPSSLDLNRFTACQIDSNGAPDAQNAFQLVKVSTLHYQPVVTSLAA